MVFAADDIILQVSVEEQVISKISYDLCSYVTSLQNGNSILLAYCNDSSMQYLDTDGQLTTSVPPPLALAVSIPCTNMPSIYLLLFATVPYPYLTYKVRGANLTGSVELDQWVADVDSWICLGVGDIIHFAFRDNLHGVIFVTIDLGAQCIGNNCIDIIILDSAECANKCKQLTLVNERWMVLEKITGVGDSLLRVFDSFSNFSTIIEANHLLISFYILLEYPLVTSRAISATSTVPFSSLPTQPVEVPTKHETSYKTVLCVVVSIVVIIIIAFTISCIIFSVISRCQTQLQR